MSHPCHACVLQLLAGTATKHLRSMAGIRQWYAPLMLAWLLLCCCPAQASYQHAFSAIRQLATSLRGALNMKTNDAYKEVGRGGVR
jgi:hypothetical protein